MFHLLENLSMTEEYRFVRHWKILIFYLRLQEIIKDILLLIYLMTYRDLYHSVKTHLHEEFWSTELERLENLYH